MREVFGPLLIQQLGLWLPVEPTHVEGSVTVANNILRQEAALAQMFNYDRREEVQPNLYPRIPILTGNPPTADLDRLREDLDPEDESRLPEDWQTTLQSPHTYDHVRMLYVVFKDIES